MTQRLEESEIARAYNKWAQTYDSDQNPTRDLAAQALKHSGLSFAEHKIIEVGCGTGRNTKWLASGPNGPSQIVALDFSEAMLRRAEERVHDPRVRFIQHDLHTRWPLADKDADLVIAMLVLEHIETLETFFAETARVLNSGGELFLCELHPMRQILGGQAQFTSPETGERQLVPAFLHNVSDYLNAALSAGFELVGMDEWRDADGLSKDLPRLLSLRLRLPSQAK